MLWWGVFWGALLGAMLAEDGDGMVFGAILGLLAAWWLRSAVRSEVRRTLQLAEKEAEKVRQVARRFATPERLAQHVFVVAQERILALQAGQVEPLVEGEGSHVDERPLALKAVLPAPELAPRLYGVAPGNLVDLAGQIPQAVLFGHRVFISHFNRH